MKAFAALVSFALVIPLAAAHGYVKSIAIDGQWYAGNIPNNYAGPSPIRLIGDIGPVKGATNPDIVCGFGSPKPAQMVVPANPGSVFSVQWSGGDGVSNWPHNIGPLMTYMTSCGNTPCNEFDPTGAKWFKIDQLGRKSDGSTWFQQDIMSDGDSFDVTLPTNLAPGGYLIRHEIIALHLATSMGGAEFYPMCTQVMIQGSGNGSPSPTISFPGAYSDNDPGIYDPDVFDAGSNYTFPGGPVANLAGTDASMAAPFTGATVFPSGTSVSSIPLPSATGGQPGASTAAGASSPAASSPGASAPPTTGAAAPSASSSGASRSSVCRLKSSGSGASNQKRHFRRFVRSLSR